MQPYCSITFDNNRSSPASLIDMINQGVIINCPFSSKNVADANSIFGPDLAFI
jgi:hypothetical protein